MEIEVKVWAYDVLTAIHEIENFVGPESDFASYQNDLKTRRAVERNLGIIGEAVGRMLKKEDSLPLTDARKIIATRNRIIHGYDSISDEIIWDIISSSLPKLKQEVERLLNE